MEQPESNGAEERASGSLERMVSRRSFEEWVSAPPYEYEVLRYPEDATKFAWPGQYRKIAVQLAWEAWCESANVRISDGADRQ